MKCSNCGLRSHFRKYSSKERRKLELCLNCFRAWSESLDNPKFYWEVKERMPKSNQEAIAQARYDSGDFQE